MDHQGASSLYRTWGAWTQSRLITLNIRRSLGARGRQALMTFGLLVPASGGRHGDPLPSAKLGIALVPGQGRPMRDPRHTCLLALVRPDFPL